MLRRLVLLTASALLATTGCASRETRPHSTSILVEAPADLPTLAQDGATDMFLHDTNDGKTYLYIETGSGRKLSILDVTDPAKIRGVANVAVSAPVAFDYVRDLTDVGALVRYRGGLGFAVLDLSQYNRPSLSQTAQLAAAASAENIGNFGLLVASGGSPQSSPTDPIRTYTVMDTAHSATPALLASVSGVKRRLTKPDTDTVFLMADNGVTVVRNLRAEEQRALQISAAKQ